jgi:hypothetical protein
MFDLLARHPDVGMLYGETEYYTADGGPEDCGRDMIPPVGVEARRSTVQRLGGAIHRHLRRPGVPCESTATSGAIQ